MRFYPNQPKFLFLFFLFPIPAYAYVDPGSGMLLIQFFVAIIGGIIVFMRNPIATVKKFFSKFRKK